MRRRIGNGYQPTKTKSYQEYDASGSFTQLFGSDVPSQVREWINSNKDKNFQFATSLAQQLEAKGTLSGSQIMTVQRIIENEQSRLQLAKRRLESAPEVSLAAVFHAFATAKQKGIARPKLRMEQFVLSLAPDSGVNAGAIYVKQSDGTYLGKVVGNKFLAINSVSKEIQDRVLEVCRNPLEEARAYGKRTGHCSVCSRLLTNHTSIDMGIGPICADKFGW